MGQKRVILIISKILLALLVVFILLFVAIILLIFLLTSSIAYDWQTNKIYNFFSKNTPPQSEIMYYHESNNGAGGATGDCYLYVEINYRTELDGQNFLKEWKSRKYNKNVSILYYDQHEDNLFEISFSINLGSVSCDNKERKRIENFKEIN